MQRKTRVSTATLTPDDVRQMFTMRSKNASYETIGERYNISKTSVQRIISRETRSDVEIPDNILFTVKNMGPCPTKTKRKRPNGDSLEKALADYTVACKNIVLSRNRCIRFGMDKDSLELLRESIRDHS